MIGIQGERTSGQSGMNAIDVPDFSPITVGVLPPGEGDWVEWRHTTSRGNLMTEIQDIEVINEALAVIDRGLAEMQYRNLVPTSEVADLLLDLRLLLMAAAAPTPSTVGGA